MKSKGSSTLPLFGFLIGVVVILGLVAIATPEVVDDPGLASNAAAKGANIRDMGDLAVKFLWVLGLMGFFKFIVIDQILVNVNFW